MSLVQVGDARASQGSIPSASPVYRLKGFENGFPTIEPNTLYEVFERSAKLYCNAPCLGSREVKNGTVGKYVFKTYAEVHKTIADVACGLKALGVAAKQRVGVFGINCPEWMISMQACNRMSYECVPIYDTLGENAIEFIVNHSSTIAVCISAAKLPALVKALDKIKDSLKIIAYWGEVDKALVKAAEEKGFMIHSWEELIKLGQANQAPAIPPSPEDLATIMYTSGTTGDPKGVMLKHSALVAAVASTDAFTRMNNISFGPGTYLFSYLPLAHIFDRVAEEAWLYSGGGIGYYQGDSLKLVDDIQELQPTVMLGVPRVYDRIHARITNGLTTAGWLRRLLFTWGVRRKLHFLRRGIKQGKASPFFDKIMFKKVAARFGGKMEILVSGGAPLSPHVEEFLRTIMCCPCIQGYGLTETCAAGFSNTPDVWDHLSTVGLPLPSTEFRLESVPDMNYDALGPEPKGEIMFRGPLLFSGYYKSPDKTAEVLDADGWFHTGDIGQIMPNGCVKIVDRKKNIFKLSQGEYVAVEKLENTFSKPGVVEQVWVYGNSFKNSLVAVVVPEEAALKTWAAANGVQGDLAAMVKDPKVKAYVLEELKAAGKADKLKGFEFVKAVHLEHVPFSVDEDLLTPTFKLKRPQLQKKYTPVIDAMYASLSE